MRHFTVIISAVLLFAVSAAYAEPPAAMPPVAVTVQPAPVPQLIVAPSTDVSRNGYAYMLAGQPGIYFFHGLWYRFDAGGWYLGHSYGGPWQAWSGIPLAVSTVDPQYPLVAAQIWTVDYNDVMQHWPDYERWQTWNRKKWYVGQLQAERDRLNVIHRKQAEEEGRRRAAEEKRKHQLDDR